MKKIKHLMIWIGLLLSLVSCKDTMEAIGIGGSEVPADGIVLRIQLPNFSENQVGTRAGESETINSLYLVFYDEDKQYLGQENVSSSVSKQSDGSYQVKIKVPVGTEAIHLVANYTPTEEEAKDLQGTFKERTPNLNAPICWGMVTVDNLLAGNTTISLIRQCAKITLNTEAVAKVFTVAGLDVRNVASKGTIAPAGYDPEHTATPLPETKDEDLMEGKVGGGTATTVAINETSKGKAFVLIKAKYHDVEGYYKVALYKDANKTEQYDLLRNHDYIIKVTRVNDYGFKSENEAVRSQPENRLEVSVVDDNPEITSMIACKDYELGVSDQQSVSATTTEVKVSVVTTLSEPTSSSGKLYEVSLNGNSWITGCKEESVTATPESGSLSSVGKKYTLSLTLTPNNLSEDVRKGKITITSGDLSLDIWISQKGYDFRRDDNRKVTLLSSNTTITDNYFDWIDKTVQGIKPEEMRGAVRNEGLHLTVGTNTYSYLIPKLNGDVVTNKDSRFTVTDNGSNWKVTLNNTNAGNFDLWQSSFTITNSQDVVITYPVYHTGIFHEIANIQHQLAEDGDDNLKVKGWFYYGVVKVKGKAHSYIMLDRNLGASNNGFYSPESTALAQYEKAIGGYFCISESKNTSDATQGNLSSTLAPSGYTIPTNDVFDDLIEGGNMQVKTYRTVTGESYNCVEISTFDSELKTIYLPYGGYLEGESLKNPIHVNLWTKSLLSGNQGFSTSSPEYGYWYRYFDVYNSKMSISNMRFVSGSNGNNTGRYKAMPIRLIYSQYIQ